MIIWIFTKTIENLNNQITELRAKVAEESKAAFNKTLKKFFEETPEIKIVQWAQYTPYFNDGDACKFSVGELNFFKDKEDMNECEEPYEYNYYWPPSDHSFKAAKNPNNRYYESCKKEIDNWNNLIETIGHERIDQINKNCNSLKKMFRMIGDENFLVMFGDHVEITATADGFSVDEYSHD